MKVPDHGKDFLVIGAAFDHHIDFEATEMALSVTPQAHVLCTLNTSQDVLDGIVHVVHDFEDLIAHGVQAHSDAL